MERIPYHREEFERYMQDCGTTLLLKLIKELGKYSVFAEYVKAAEDEMDSLRRAHSERYS